MSYANSAKKNKPINYARTARYKYFTVAMRNITKENPDTNYDSKVDKAIKLSDKIDWSKRENISKWFNVDLYK